MIVSSAGSLFDANAYDVNLIPALEAHVREQAATQTYDARANKALLKLYQFFPEKTDTTVLALLIGKSIMALPSPEFANLRFLVPAAIQDQEPLLLSSSSFTLGFGACQGSEGRAEQAIAEGEGFRGAVRCRSAA